MCVCVCVLGEGRGGGRETNFLFGLLNESDSSYGAQGMRCMQSEIPSVRLKLTARAIQLAHCSAVSGCSQQSGQGPGPVISCPSLCSLATYKTPKIDGTLTPITWGWDWVGPLVGTKRCMTPSQTQTTHRPGVRAASAPRLCSVCVCLCSVCVSV